ncbi:MAG: PEP-CTERM sorting domain-containing protein [Gammaproteobacteria bacterium]
MQKLAINMKYVLIILSGLLEFSIALAGPYAPAAGQPGTTAIAHDDPRLTSWATVATVDYGDATALPDFEFRDSSRALGPAKSPQEAVFDIVSLGRGGAVTLQFDKPIVNGDGADFAVFENSFSDTFLELAYVWVSDGSLALDGSGQQLFLPFDSHSLTNSAVNAFGTLDPTNINGLAGKYRGGFGTPFDLSDLGDLIADIQNVVPTFSFDLNNITHVKIVDVVGDGSDLDTTGNPIYDPFATSGSMGFDLDAVGVIHQLGGPPDPEPEALQKQVPLPLPAILMLAAVLTTAAIRGLPGIECHQRTAI